MIEPYYEHNGITMKLKECKSCKKELPLSDYRKNAKTSDGLTHRCKVCTKSAGAKKGYKQSLSHIEKRIRLGPNHHAWKGSRVTRKTGWKRARTRYGDIENCESCGALKMDIHHINDNSLDNRKENIKALCRRCHMVEDGRLDELIELAKENQPKAVAARWD